MAEPSVADAPAPLSSVLETKRPLQVNVLGLPVIDYIAPSEKELAEGLVTLNAAKEKFGLPLTQPLDNPALEALRLSLKDGAAHIHAAEQAVKAFQAFAAENAKPNSKPTLTSEQESKVADLFAPIMVAAEDISRAAQLLHKEDKALTVRHIGGSMVNKMHAIKAALGDDVQINMLGVLAPENSAGDRAFVFDSLKASGIGFTEIGQGDVALDHMPTSYIIQTESGRIPFKVANTGLPQKLAGHLGEIRAFADPAHTDVYFMEGSDVGDAKFGYDAFTAYSDQALAADDSKSIVFSAPTATDLVTTHPNKQQYQELFDAIIDSPKTGFISCNESEAVALFKHETFSNPDHTPLIQQGQLHGAIMHLQQRLLRKMQTTPETGIEPIGFISLGKEGAEAISPFHTPSLKAMEGAKEVNNIGAGDAFFGGLFANYVQQLSTPRVIREDALPRNHADGQTHEPLPARQAKHRDSENRHDGRYHFSIDNLRDMMGLGRRIAFEVVEQKGAQLDADRIRALAQSVPTSGVYQGNDLQQRQQMGKGL